MTPFLIATLLALIGVGTLALLYRRGNRRRFRQALAVALAGVLVVVAYLHWISGGQLDRIEASQVALADLRMTEAAGSFRLEGRVLNRSASLTLASVPVRLVVEDCGVPGSGGSCRALLDDSAEILVTVPPGGSNDFHHVYTATAIATPGSASTHRWHAVAGAPRAFAAAPR